MCIDSKDWQRISCTGDIPLPRRNASCVATDKEIYIFGGYVERVGYSNGLHVLNKGFYYGD